MRSVTESKALMTPRFSVTKIRPSGAKLEPVGCTRQFVDPAIETVHVAPDITTSSANPAGTPAASAGGAASPTTKDAVRATSSIPTTPA